MSAEGREIRSLWEYIHDLECRLGLTGGGGPRRQFIKADGAVGASIEITKSMDAKDMSMGAIQRTWDVQAVGLADTLLSSLPGGVLHRLLAELMRRCASDLVVPLREGADAERSL